MVLRCRNRAAWFLVGSGPAACRWRIVARMPTWKVLQTVSIASPAERRGSLLRPSARGSIVRSARYDPLALLFPIYMGRVARPADPNRGDHGAPEDATGVPYLLRVHVFPDAAVYRSLYDGPDGPIHE